MRRVLEGQGDSVGVYAGFDGGESCKAGAGDAKGVRKAVEAVRAGRDSAVIVLGECADYRQVNQTGAWEGGWGTGIGPVENLAQAATTPHYLYTIVFGSRKSSRKQKRDLVRPSCVTPTDTSEIHTERCVDWRQNG